MLVLTRKTDERIQIGDDITITVVKIRGGHVRIGIEAPRGIRILRGELEARDDDANNQPAKGASDATAGSDVALGSDVVGVEKTPADTNSVELDTVDDIAAVFAHPARNQVRGRSGRRVAAKVTRTSEPNDALPHVTTADRHNTTRRPLRAFVSA